jgi:hypothetical protein
MIGYTLLSLSPACTNILLLTNLSFYRSDYGHVIAVGSGTGVVPMMSLLKSTYSRLVKVNALLDSTILNTRYKYWVLL